MKRDEVQKEIINIGIAYFQDWVPDFETPTQAVNSILEEIKNHASGSKPTGLGSWEVQEEAVRVALQELKPDKLDRLLEHYYGINPETIGGSKAFFEKLHTTIQEGINESSRRNSQK